MPVGPDFLAILRILNRYEVDFAICGGIASILHGAPVMTADLDILHNPSTSNCERLLGALRELEATYVDAAGRKILPDLAKLEEFRMNLFVTSLGRLDVLKEIGAGKTYSDLVDRCIQVEVDGMSLRVLDLEAIIESKESANRPKDRMTLPFLKTLLEMKAESSEEP